jgi:hypothetical protein
MFVSEGTVYFVKLVNELDRDLDFRVNHQADHLQAHCTGYWILWFEMRWVSHLGSNVPFIG